MTDYKWCAIDAEGDVGRKGLLGVAFYSDIVQDYIEDHGVIKRLLYEHAEKGYTFLAHNAQYDLPVIFWQLGIDIKAVYYNGRFNRGEWKYQKNSKLCQLWDTLALSGGLSLEKLGIALHLRKYPTPQNLLGISPDRYKWFCEKHNRGECESCYAVRDAEIVYCFMAELGQTLASWGIEPHRRISGLAMKVWQVFDEPNNIAIHDKRIRQLARLSYHGGRVETFKLGRIHGLYAADVCSMYPSVMLDAPYPDPTSMVYLDNPAQTSVPLQYEGCVHVDITIPPMHVPPLPFVHKGMIKYPVGRMLVYCTFAELRYAVSLGATINRIWSAAFSPTNLYPFTQFVSILWGMRQEYEAKGDPRSLFAKLLMNNLYGRLGMQEGLERKDIFPLGNNTTLKKTEPTYWYTDDGRIFVAKDRHQPSRNQWSNVLWAAQTTAYARMRLHAHLMAQGTNVVYCDTDSVFSTQPIVGLGEGLGALRDEQYYPEAIIAAPKLYAVKRQPSNMPDTWSTARCEKHKTKSCEQCLWHPKAKGVPYKVAMDFLLKGVATYEQPIKPSSQASRKIVAGTWVEVTKHTQRVPHRRHPVDPAALLTDYGSSDTAPEVVGPTP